MTSNLRPKECLQELQSHYSFVSVLYNTKLRDVWIVVCRDSDESIKVTGDSYNEVLRNAVKRKRK